MAYYVFAVFDPSKAALVSTWIRSWEARGWKALILSAREVKEAGGVRKAAARRNRAAFVIADLLTINFSLPAKRGQKIRAVALGNRGWLTAGLVKMPDVGAIYSCGRTLCL